MEGYVKNTKEESHIQLVFDFLSITAKFGDQYIEMIFEQAPVIRLCETNFERYGKYVIYFISYAISFCKQLK